jgi:hypothetical protein
MTRVFAIFIVCIIAGFLCISCSNSDQKSTESKQPSQNGTKASRQGEVKKDLGSRPYGFGSSNQAQELLNLINENQSKADYQVSYNTEDETILFGCNFNKDVIIRIHQRKDGRGTQEMWKGYIVERLDNAASGGSLNDTPVGKKAGTFQSF